MTTPKLTQAQTRRALRAAGWTSTRGLWKTDKRGLKRHTANGLTLREAASIEMIDLEWRPSRDVS